MRPTIQRLTGVYNARGGVLGEAAYAAGKLFGVTHCALCDITHRGLRAKASWSRLVGNLGVPFDVVHLNERSAEVAMASSPGTPCVLAHTDGGMVYLLGPAQLEPLHGDVDAFNAVLHQSIERAGLTWPDSAFLAE